MALSNPFLAELATAFGIATEFWDWKGRLTEVTDETVIAILAAMDVDASDPGRASAALEALRLRPWTRLLPPCVVMEQGTAKSVQVHLPDGAWVRLAVRLEEGGFRDAAQVADDEPPRWVDGVLTGQASFELPADLPVGYHRLQATTEAGQAESTLVVSPAFLGFPAAMGEKRAWGYAAQLYSVTSEDSWGFGDLLDLADLSTWSATQQFASYVLVNPLHAAQPVPPIEASPYLPTSRRYVNPLYIRPEQIPEYAELDERSRNRVAQLKARLKKELATEPLISRDQVWVAKIDALRVVYDHGLRPARRMAFNDFLRREGRSLTQFATWSALVSRFGGDWRDWPAELRRPSSPTVALFAEQHVDQIIFYAWLQWIADNQLRAAQSAAKDAGMRIGIMNDLAVGVGGSSAEAWTYGNLFADRIGVGAPPDHFNQTGQDWGQAPWRPDRLDDLSYAPFRSMVAGLLRHSGGIRVDHIMGLFRLWWIPEGMAASQGAYVRYNHEAMVGILALEAQRAGALVVGEDLGVVEPWVREYLRHRGILGTSIAWFERGPDGTPLAPEDWREYCLASVTTHDLPPTAGYLAGEHVKLQHELGLLTESLDAELATAERERTAFIDALRQRGFLAAQPATTQDIVEAMHRYLVATPSRVLCAALTDAVGDRRTQNQPGTDKEYPNWRIPLSGPDGKALSLEKLYRDDRAFRLASIMNGFGAPMVVPRADTELVI
ncbi:4-alpha-glucanotransferase [Propionicimonas sp.]|uniref:4-alpha-glucanotransferase n=1 Tax=Propionicimonas sp. TaxID=1955623 RepID=UPI0039E3FFDA